MSASEEEQEAGQDFTQILDEDKFFVIGPVSCSHGATLLLCTHTHTGTSHTLRTQGRRTANLEIKKDATIILLPSRADRAVHHLDGRLTWYEGTELKYIDISANNIVLRVKSLDGGDDESGGTFSLFMPVSACSTDHANPHADSPSNEIVTEVYLRGVFLNPGTGSRAKDRGLKLGSEAVLDDARLICGVRWATEDEMTMLATEFFEKPTAYQHGDVYLPEEPLPDMFLTLAEIAENAKRAKQKGKAKKKPPILIMARDDAFDYFERLKRLSKGQLGKHLQAEYMRYTSRLVVEKEFPKYTDGRSARAVREQGEKLWAALEVAGCYLARWALDYGFPSELPQLDKLIAPDLPVALARQFDMQQTRPTAAPSKEPSKAKGKAGQKSAEKPKSAAKQRTSGGGSRSGGSGGGGGGSGSKQPVVTQAAAIENLQHELAEAKQQVSSHGATIRQLNNELSHVHNTWRVPYLANERSLQMLSGCVEMFVAANPRVTGITSLQQMLGTCTPAKRPISDVEMGSASPPRVTRQRSATPPQRRPP
jgi:uncharacterized membrane protein YgcG